jgi:glutathione peroxidase
MCKHLFLILLILLGTYACGPKESSSETAAVATFSQPNSDASMAKSVHEFTLNTLSGTPQSLKEYAGKVLVIVNVASKCGYTPQYADLQKFYDEYQQKGLVILGFPANNFGNQEPGTDADIAQFCQANYGVTFPMFSKLSVKGADIHPLYKYLTQESGVEVSWNFNKFIVNKEGKVIKHFKSAVKPDDKEFLQTIKAALEA